MYIGAVIIAALLSESPRVDLARYECSTNLRSEAEKAKCLAQAIPEAERQDAEEEAGNKRAVADFEREKADAAELQAKARETAAREEESLAKKCGKDLGRVRVGMKFARVKECAGDFEIVGQDGTGTIYEATGGLVRVERGRVTRWVAK